ncbi:MAG: hypothetical protein ACOCXJ_05425, partial [Planctomycetota bacterium]
MSATDDLLARFAEPPMRCRPMLQWSWNEDIQEERVEAVIEQCREQGIGGFFAHARPGLLTPYLSERWFQVWDHAMRCCRERGMEWHLYDEFTAGGGSAGGQSYELAPQAEQRELTVVPVVDPQQAIDGIVLDTLRLDPDSGAVQEAALDQAAPGAPVLALVHRMRPKGAKGIGRQVVDLCHPDATRAFLACTHERYAAHSSAGFGTTVRFCFNDEPHCNQSRSAYAWSPYIRQEFLREHGYDLQERLRDLLFWQEQSAVVRHDFHRTLERLYNTNFCRVEHDWCAAHGLAFTGHFMEHEWPRPIGQPSSMSALRWMQAPGNDLLGSQFKDSLAENRHYLLNLKELTSVANQYERADIMVESCGAGGWDKSFALFKACEDFLLAFRVNVMDPHLGHYSVVGARKMDFAQSISDHSPWFAHYRSHADHVARVIAAHAGSVERNRVLVLHPTRSGWLHHQPAGFPWNRGDNAARLDELRQQQDDLILDLYRQRIDFDLGEEALLEESGRVDGAQLCVGAGRYDLVVVPAGLETLSAANTDLLAAWLAAGGRVLQEGAAWTRVGGRPSPRPAGLQQEHAGQWQRHGERADLVAAVATAVPPRIACTEAADDLVWCRSQTADGSVLYFFA